jgi:pyrimidine oxygenase
MGQDVDYGLFIPIANDGWITSTTSPKYMPTFDLNKQIVQKAEGYGFGFALSMIKLRGYGGATEHWDYALESFTLMAGLAAVTDKMKLYASVATPTLHPAMVARMSVTIDSIAPGRFGVNIVAGWNKSEYEQMGLWPGDEFYEFRYDYASEYVQIMRELWTKGHSDFKGRFFELDDCVCKPLPVGDIKVVSAGASERGKQFTAEFCDYNFTGTREGPAGVARINADLAEAAAKTGRDCSTFLSFMVILGETDADAQRKVDLYNSGVDLEALAFMKSQAALDTKSTGTSARMVAAAPKAVHDGAIVGSPETVAAYLREIEAVPGTGGIMLTFDDFIEGVEIFGSEVMPLLS